MSHLQYVALAWIVGIGSMVGVLIWSWRAMLKTSKKLKQMNMDDSSTNSEE